jgi:hypothetical protein
VKANEKDEGPFQIDLLQAIWWHLEQVCTVLHSAKLVACSAAELRRWVDEAQAEGHASVIHPTVALILRILAAPLSMHCDDYLRMKGVEAQLPRRKLDPSVDLQIRLRGLEARRVVCQLDDVTETYRVTIKNVRGDVASAAGATFPNALEGAIKMAGARDLKGKDR